MKVSLEKTLARANAALPAFQWSNLIIGTGNLALMMQWLLTIKDLLCVSVLSTLSLMSVVFCCVEQKQQLLISIH